jgi:hypothetical protein
MTFDRDGKTLSEALIARCNTPVRLDIKDRVGKVLEKLIEFDAVGGKWLGAKAQDRRHGRLPSSHPSPFFSKVSLEKQG